MAIKLKTPGEYKRAIKALRQYADGFTADDGFDLRTFTPALNKKFVTPLTNSQKRKVKKYFDVLQRHAGYKNVNYQKFKSPEKLKSAQKAMGMPSKQSWRGVFVPEPSEATPAKLVQRKPRGGKPQWVIEYSEQGVDTVFVPFDRILFADLGTDYIRSLFIGAPPDFKYNVDMGHGRNRWKAGGNLEQVLRDIDFMIARYSHYAEFIRGIHVYRANWDEFNTLKKQHEKTAAQKRREQEYIKKIISRERRKMDKYENEKRTAKAFVRDGRMTRAAYRKYYGEPD